MRNIMQNKIKIAEIMGALGNVTRLDILDLIAEGISNPGALSKKLASPRPTIEKHLRVLLKANVISKYPGLSPEGQTRIYYRIAENFNPFLSELNNLVK
ncbi:MAG: ArsR family transcriptional regulator [Promethearchaeota archaeon]|nr:MAG: ArsR family transcriptional regulator [Candidatus Lokiarchaeota archaeon]